MIQVYDWKNKNYNRNGDMILEPISCTLEVGLDLTLLLELEHKYDEIGRWKYLKKQNIISVPAPKPWKNDQLFRIYDYKKTKNSIKVYARHIYFDLKDKVLLDVRPTEKRAQEALNIILSETQFTGVSNIEKINTAYYVRKKITAAIAGEDENSFLTRWGGEVFPDNYMIYINDKIGEDNGVRVEFGLNLDEIEEDVDCDNVVTRIIPVGSDEIMLEGNQPWVDSKNINAYANIKEEVFEYSDIKVISSDSNSNTSNSNSSEDNDNTESKTEEGYKTLAEAQQALKEAAQKEFDENKVDEPTVNYTVKMIDLVRTTQYKKYKALEEIGLGDIVTCKHKEIDIDVQARCIKLKFDCITKTVTEIELGNFVKNYFEEQEEINDEILNIKGIADNMYTKQETDKIVENTIENNTKDYVTGAQVDSKINSKGYITTTQINTKLNSYVTKTTYENKIQELEKKIDALTSTN